MKKIPKEFEKIKKIYKKLFSIIFVDSFDKNSNRR